MQTIELLKVLASLLIWLPLVMGCAGHDHQHLDEPLPPLVYADPETAQAMKEGNRYFKEGWWTGAEKQYRIAILAFPAMAEAHYNLGLTLNKQGGRYQESRDHFTRALKNEFHWLPYSKRAQHLRILSVSLTRLLNWRAWDGSERTKHTTITCFWLQ
jgi:tetratricopeptide (TPR) repeat protein